MGTTNIDYTGQIFNGIKLIEDTGKRKWSSSIWVCICRCGKEFEASGSQIKSGQLKSCGCAIQEAGKNRRSKLKNITFIEITENKCGSNYIWKVLCNRCGTHFEAPSSRVINGNVRSCGCLAKEVHSKRMTQIGINNKLGNTYNYLKVVGKAERTSYWIVECLYKDCGKIYEIHKNALRIQESCGCKRNEMLKNRTGSKSPNWNPNLSYEDRIKDRKVKENDIWRFQVYERDNYICQACDKKSNGDIVAHHLNGWHWCEEERFDINNGVTLCEFHHKDFHSIYGVKYNTKEQFEKYLELYHNKKLRQVI